MEWEDTGKNYSDLKIYRKGKERRLVDRDGKVVMEYKSKFD